MSYFINPYSFGGGAGPGYGLRLDLQADVLSLSDNDPVSTWADSSDEENDATQSGTPRPIYKATSGPGGMPCVRFNGSDQWMQLTSEIVVPSASFSVFAVVRPNDVGICTLLAGNSGSPSIAAAYLQLVLTKLDVEHLCWSTAYISDTEFTQVNIRYTGSWAYWRIARTADTTQNTGAYSFDGGFTKLGARGLTPASFMNGDLAMMKVFNYFLDDTATEAEEDAIYEHWGV